MKILKPGKVELRKFKCYKCGCEFVADESDVDRLGDVHCPTVRCVGAQVWHAGEPYEEPAKHSESDVARLTTMLECIRSLPTA